MAALYEATNIYNTAIGVLLEKGFQVWLDPKTGRFWAEKDGWDFACETLCGLLGLVTIFEARAPLKYQSRWWRKKEDSGLLRSLPSKAARPYVSVARSTDEV